jgi:hypothetical protein
LTLFAIENSPALQRRVKRPSKQSESRQGRKKINPELRAETLMAPARPAAPMMMDDKRGT